MSLIKDKKKSRKNGGYTRLFGNEELGSLISKTQGTVISSGTELEKKIWNNSNKEKIIEKKLLINYLNNPYDGEFLIKKKILKDSQLIKNKSPDIIFLKVKNRNKHCYIIELKDGDTFDTKKVAGEIASLNDIEKQLKSKMNFTFSKHFCSFNLNDKKMIIKGFKNKISEKEAMTGRELCEIIGVDYAKILKMRKENQEENLIFFINNFLKIDVVKKHLLKKKFPKQHFHISEQN